MSRDWTHCLEEIVESGQRIASYTHEMSLEEFRSNQLVFDAVVRNLEIIGEAARHLPAELDAAMPDAAWSRAAAFRDVIARQYFGLDIQIVWDLAHKKVPQLVRSASATLNERRRGRNTSIS